MFQACVDLTTLTLLFVCPYALGRLAAAATGVFRRAELRADEQVPEAVGGLPGDPLMRLPSFAMLSKPAFAVNTLPPSVKAITFYNVIQSLFCDTDDSGWQGSSVS